MESCGTRVESLQSFVEPCETSRPTALAESCGNLKPSYNLTSNHPGPPRSPRRISWDPARTVLEWNLTFQNLVELWWDSHGTLPQTSPDRWWNPGPTLVEPSWNLPRTTPHPRRNWWNPGGTLVRSTTGWWNPGGNLVEPSWNLSPRLITLQPSQNLVKPWQNSGEPSWNLPQTRPPPPSKKLLEPWWNPRGTLPQTTPDHPAALVEPLWNLTSNHPDHPAAWNPDGTLAEPS